MNDDLRIGTAAVTMAMILLTLVGCGKKAEEPAAPQAVEPGAAEVAKVRDALTRGMQPIAVASLTAAHVGKRCVILARSTPIPPPPPPLGMVRLMGSTSLYMAELAGVSPAAVTIRAPYPTSGNVKTVEIPRADIQSVHLGN